MSYVDHVWGLSYLMSVYLGFVVSSDCLSRVGYGTVPFSAEERVKEVLFQRRSVKKNRNHNVIDILFFLSLFLYILFLSFSPSLSLYLSFSLSFSLSLTLSIPTPWLLCVASGGGRIPPPP